MLCETCHLREATVHFTTTVHATGPDLTALGLEPGTKRQQHFCEQCADSYLSCTPGMNRMRNLICLSDSYRTRLYDLLEAAHPEAFYHGDDRAQCRRVAEVMDAFLREQLKKEKIEFNEDAFGMLFGDFIGSNHFYTRRKEYHSKKS